MPVSGYSINLKAGGLIHLYDNWIDPDRAVKIYQQLSSEPFWSQTTYQMGERILQVPRLLALMQDDGEYINEYRSRSSLVDDALVPWTPLMLHLKKTINNIFNIQIKYAYLNKYRNGQDSIGFHSDKELTPGGTVVSISLGASRRFLLQSKQKHIKDDIDILLQNGTLLLFDYEAGNSLYKHSVPRTRVKDGHHCQKEGQTQQCTSAHPVFGCERINITFRT